MTAEKESIPRSDHFLMVKCDYMDNGFMSGLLANVIHVQEKMWKLFQGAVSK